MKIFRYILLLLFSFSCSKDDSNSLPEYVPTPLALEIPILFEQKILPPIIPFSNPQTVEGVALKRFASISPTAVISPEVLIFTVSKSPVLASILPDTITSLSAVILLVTFKLIFQIFSLFVNIL